MGGNEFINVAKNAIAMYMKEPQLDSEDIQVVWLSKTLQNCKGLFFVPAEDGFYFELTYNGNEDEVYLDVYEKSNNVVIVRAD